MTPQDNIRFIAPVAVKAAVARAEEEVLAKVKAASRYESCCSRCLKVLQRDLVADFRLVFDVEKHMEFIVLDEDIRQELILNLPTRLLCQDDCKGLCVECGVNLNDQECEHKQQVSGVSLKS